MCRSAREGVRASLFDAGRCLPTHYFSHLGEAPPVYLYLPASAPTQTHLAVVVRFDGGFAALGHGMRAAARRLDPDLPVDIQLAEDNLEVWRVSARLGAAAAGTLGALALALAAIGLYGLVASA